MMKIVILKILLLGAVYFLTGCAQTMVSQDAQVAVEPALAEDAVTMVEDAGISGARGYTSALGQLCRETVTIDGPQLQCKEKGQWHSIPEIYSPLSF